MNKIETSSQQQQQQQLLIPDVTVLNDLPTDGITCLQYMHKTIVTTTDEERLVSTSWDGRVRIHNTSTKSCIVDYNMNSGPLLSLTILQQQQQQQSSSPSSTTTTTTSLVTGGCDGSIRQLDIETSTMTLIGKHIHPDNSDKNSSVACSCLGSIDPNIIISAGWHQLLHVWDIRMSSSSSSTQSNKTNVPQHTISLPGKAFAMDIEPKNKNLIAVATSGRRNCFIDIRYSSSKDNNLGMVVNDCTLLLDRESSLKYQTRCLQFFPNGDSIVLGSIEGRAAVEFLDDLEPLRRQPNDVTNIATETSQSNNNNSSNNTKFAFKCHRINDMVYPVNAVVCHPLYGTFATGGCDGTVVFWDAINKKKITSIIPTFPTSVSALAFNDDGTEIAIASSYTFEEGEREHPKDEIYIRPLLKSECSPKVKGLILYT